MHAYKCICLCMYMYNICMYAYVYTFSQDDMKYLLCLLNLSAEIVASLNAMFHGFHRSPSWTAVERFWLRGPFRTSLQHHWLRLVPMDGFDVL